jgi:trk system potassium uptake protein TrkH
MVLPLAVDLIHTNWWGSFGFAIAGIASSGLGELARRMHPGGTDLTQIEGLAVVSLVWLVIALIGSVPYAWSGMGLIDSFFESMSGFTTTGATIMQDFTLYSRAIFFWRSLTQWIGGMGVIALFVAVLPKLGIAGRQLFFGEAPGPTDDRLTPRIRHTAIALWKVYVLLTLAQVVLLRVVGLPLFDAICNSLTTLAAGGFSPHPFSIAGYQNPAAEWIFIVFMFLAGANFSLQYRAFRESPAELLRDEELRTYTGLVLISTLLVAAALYQLSVNAPVAYLTSPTTTQPLSQSEPTEQVRHAAFQVLSVLTTTGFASDDFNLWNDQSKVVLLVLMFIGGSAGSAAGGPKIVRMLLIAKYAYLELFKAIHPQAVKPVRLGSQVVPPAIMRSITAFLLLYLVMFTLGMLVLVAFGTDLLTSITASIATLGNIGPGFGIVGPMGSFAGLHPVSKLMLIINMWVGRLEVMTVLVLVQPQVWKSVRIKD